MTCDIGVEVRLELLIASISVQNYMCCILLVTVTNIPPPQSL